MGKQAIKHLEPSEVRGMSRSAKLVLGIAAGALAFMMLCGVSVLGAGALWGWEEWGSPARTGWVANSVEDADHLVAEIAAFDLPESFSTGGRQAVETFGLKVAEYTAADGHSHIVLAQAPRWLNLDAAGIERMLGQSDDVLALDHTAGMREVGREMATINGQRVEVVFHEGRNHDGERFRTLTGVFEGRGGTCMVMVERPVEVWDQVEAMNFLASIR
jgi:hypothetical protein